MRASDEPSGRRALTDEQLLAMSDEEFDQANANIASLLAEGPAPIDLETPPAGLWAAIASAVATDSANQGISNETITVTGRRTIDPLGQSDEAQSSEPAPAKTRARSRWGGRTAVLTLVAAAVLLVLVPVGLSLGSNGDEPVVLASAQLEALTADATSGSADLIADDDDLLELQLEATAPEGEYLELWLLAVGEDGRPVDMVSLGKADGSGEYAIPAGVDTSVFNVVDVSIEADDGDASHSGKSVLRGALTT